MVARHNPYGRETRETRPDGTVTNTTYESCLVYFPSGCPANYISTTRQHFLDSGGAEFTDTRVYTDAFDRPLDESQKVIGDGVSTYSYVTRNYDALGRLSHITPPALSSNWSWSLETTFSYDLLGRTTQISHPTSDANFTPQIASISYAGLTTTTTDELGKNSTRIVDASGALRITRDPDNYSLVFDFDAFGNVARVQDSNGNTLQSSSYNIRGMLTARTDMDMGAWAYDPDALGDVLHVRDAKTSSPSWTQTLGYDGLGRLTTRSETEGTSTWTWGTSIPDKELGKLHSVSGPGYSESYLYDTLGRPLTTTISADSINYQIGYTYNAAGGLDTLTYPASTGASPLKLQYEYQAGQLKDIKDFNSLTTVYWSGDFRNGRGDVTKETLGAVPGFAGIVVTRPVDVVTGLLKSIQTGVGGGNAIQNLSYEWDVVGNLKKRTDLNQSGLAEQFFYDNLYRLDYSTLNGVTNLDMAYDALGNITSKSDVGAYTYHSTRKHQVVSTSNGWSFGYDANGNMTSGRGATTDWTSYNYPACIRTGASCAGTGTDYSAFSYTPDRQYWKQVSNYAATGGATTTYIAGILEKVETTLGTDYRHMIRAGGSTIIVSRQSSGTNSVYYVVGDQLGSSSAVMNSSGGVVLNSSFGAFGARRGSNWTGSPGSSDWTAIAGTTRRGFTEQTMLDNLNLTHMNGRVYDQMLGRFLSADPFTSEPLNTQNYNRYSYVYNNPLSALDPSGFEEEDADDRRRGPRFEFSFPGLFGDAVGFGWFYQLTRDAMMEKPDAASNSPGQILPPQIPWEPNTQWSACGIGGRYEEQVPPMDGHYPADVGFWEVNPLRYAVGKTIGDTFAPFTEAGVNPLTGHFLTPGELKDIKLLNFLNVASAGLAADASAAARAAAQLEAARGSNIVYRGLAASENPAAGLAARAPGIGNSPASHVAGARASQWISTTRSAEVAANRFGQNGVVAIDLNKVPGTVVDLTQGISGLAPNTMLSRWAINAQEVLILDSVPARAIVGGP